GQYLFLISWIIFFYPFFYHNCLNVLISIFKLFFLDAFSIHVSITSRFNECNISLSIRRSSNRKCCVCLMLLRLTLGVNTILSHNAFSGEAINAVCLGEYAILFIP